MRISERAVAACLAVTLLAASTPTARCAEPSAVELEAARKLFDDGVKQEEAGDWSSALATFRRVAAVKSSAAVHFHLGLCLEKTGKWVEALSEFLAAERDGKATTNQAVADLAHEHATSLRKRVPSVVLIARAGEQPAVTIDGQSISAALIGADIPLDPGAHLIEARAPGYRPLKREIELEERSVQRVELTMIRADGPAVDVPTTTSSTRFGAWPWIATGVAVAGLGASGVFYGLSAREAAHLDGACEGSRCPTAERDAYDRGRTFTTAGNVLLVVGSIAAVSAVTLFVFNRDTTTVSVAASPRAITLSVAF